MRAPVTTPPLVLLALEAPRWTFEYFQFAMAQRTLLNGPRGDGRGVLVIPGLGGNNAGTAPLRRLLGQMGHDAQPWFNETNLGQVRQYEDTVELLQKMAVDGPVNIIGHSLGGLYARLLARSFPDLVHKVVTLASPFRLQPWDRTSVTTIGCMANTVPAESLALWQSEDELPPLPVAATAIYSMTDGVVRSSLCFRDDEDSVEISGCHTGMVHNPYALTVILDRLQGQSTL